MRKGMKFLFAFMLTFLIALCIVVGVVVFTQLGGDDNNDERIHTPGETIAEPVVHEMEDHFFWQSALQKVQGEEYWRYYPTIPEEAVAGDIVRLSVPSLGFVSWDADTAHTHVEFTTEPSDPALVRASFVVPEEEFRVSALYTDIPNDDDGVFIFNYESIESGQTPQDIRFDDQRNPDGTYPTVPLRYGMFGNVYGFRPGAGIPAESHGEFIHLVGFPGDATVTIEGFGAVLGGASVEAEVYNMWYSKLSDGMSFRIHGTPQPAEGWFDDEGVDRSPITPMVFSFNIVVEWTVMVPGPDVLGDIKNPDHDPSDPDSLEYIQGYVPGPDVREDHIVTRPFTFTILPRPRILEKNMPEGMVGAPYGGLEAQAAPDPYNTRISVNVPSFIAFPRNLFNPPTPAVPCDINCSCFPCGTGCTCDPCDDNCPCYPGDPGDGDWYELGGTQWRFSVTDVTEPRTGYTFPAPVADITGEHPSMNITIESPPGTDFSPNPTVARTISILVRLEAVAQHPSQVQRALTDPDFVGNPLQIQVGFVERIFDITILPRPYFTTPFDALKQAMDGTIRSPSTDLDEPPDEPYEDFINIEGFPLDSKWEFIAGTGSGAAFDEDPGKLPAGLTIEPYGPVPLNSGAIIRIEGIPSTSGLYPITVRFDSSSDPNPNIRAIVERTFNLIIWPRTYLYITMAGQFEAGFVRRVSPEGTIEAGLDEHDPDSSRQYIQRRAVMPGTLGVISTPLAVQGFVRWEHDRFAAEDRKQPLGLPVIGGPVGSNTHLPGHSALTGHTTSASHAFMVMEMPIPGGRDAPNPDLPPADVYIRGYQGAVPEITVGNVILSPTARTPIPAGMAGQAYIESVSIRAADIGAPADIRQMSWQIVEPREFITGLDVAIDASGSRFTELRAAPLMPDTYNFTIGVNLRGTMRIDRDVSILIDPHSTRWGDVNNDSYVDLRDLILLARHIQNPFAVPIPTEEGREAADLDGDGHITGGDLSILMRHFSVPDSMLPSLVGE